MTTKPKRRVRSKAERLAACRVIFDEMHNGQSMRKSCIKAGVKTTSFCNWLALYPDLKEQYEEARVALIEKMADDLLEISDSEPERNPLTGAIDPGSVSKHRLQVDARKWVLSKIAPKKYGDRIAIAGDEDSPVKVEHSLDVKKLSTQALAEIMAAKDAETDEAE